MKLVYTKMCTQKFAFGLPKATMKCVIDTSQQCGSGPSVQGYFRSGATCVQDDNVWTIGDHVNQANGMLVGMSLLCCGEAGPSSHDPQQCYYLSQFCNVWSC
jgi:hypothetical protein